MKSNFLIKFLMVDKTTNEKLPQAALLFCTEEELQEKVIEIHTTITEEFNKLDFLLYLEDIIRI
jgi:HD superfamily phosphohydrolase YqeK